MPRLVAINENGNRIGETHQRSTIPDFVVDLIRELREDRFLTYGQIALRLKLKKSTVVKIANYERRAQTPARWVRVMA